MTTVLERHLQQQRARNAAADALAVALRDARSAINSLEDEALGKDPEIGYHYKDELLSKIATALSKWEEVSGGS